MKRALACLTALLWGAVLAAGDVVPAYTPANARERFAVDLLARLGNTRPSADTVAFVVAWQDAEGTSAAYNPIATSQDMPRATIFNSDGVKNYQTYEDGIEATALTLEHAYPGYADILTGLQTNDPARAFAGLSASPWGTNADTAKALWGQAPQPATAGIASAPIAYQGDDCAWNVAIALQAIGSNVEIPAGGWWSFNQAMGDPGRLDYRTCAGVPGGNWCNLAARYAQAARALGAHLTFQDHGVDLGAGRENSVTIWNESGQAGGQDLIIENTSNAPLRLSVQDIGGGQVRIVGGTE